MIDTVGTTVAIITIVLGGAVIIGVVGGIVSRIVRAWERGFRTAKKRRKARHKGVMYGQMIRLYPYVFRHPNRRTPETRERERH